MAVTTGAYYAERPADGTTMAGMTTQPAHAKPAYRDHLWVLAVIAGFALFDVWESWTEVGNKSGFAHGTGWTLTIIVEAFAGYSLYAWFSAPGQRSRRFAMWSAITVLALSLIGQGSSTLAAHAMPPVWLAVFVKDLPVVVLALIAVLVHIRRLDREEAAAASTAQLAAEQAAAASADDDDDRAALQAGLEAAVSARADAEQRAEEALRRADELAAKLAKVSASRSRTQQRENGQDEDITTEFRALDELQKDPTLRGPRMGAELGRRIGVSSATGRRLHAKLTARGQSGGSLSERSDERSGERS